MPTTLVVEASGTTSQGTKTGNGIRVARNKEVKKMVILLVEDHELVRNAVKDILSRNGHEVLAVEDGAVAMENLVKMDFQIDYLITDLDMPRLDGFGLLEMVKEWNFTKWLFSGTILDNENREKAVSLGASRVIWKTEIYSTLREAGLI